MKEWGMLARPGNGVRLPVQGILGMDAAARAVGQGVSDLASGSLSLIQAQRKVTTTGDLAAFSARLHEIGQETREELSGMEIRDWDYSWNESCTPKLDAAIREMPESSRQAASELARSFSAQASLKARRDAELGRIDQARKQWQSRIDESVEAGDMDQAREWLEVGHGVFVPESQMEDRLKEIQSRCCLSGWRKKLQESPLQALASWEDEEQRRPLRDKERLQLEGETREIRRQLSSSLAALWQESLGEGRLPDPDQLALAEKAGVISTSQRHESLAPFRPLDTAQWCDWIRQIDEREENDDAALRLQIATSALPAEERFSLLKRMDSTDGVPVVERQAVSRRLWNMYRNGCLGCLGDQQAVQRWKKLQETGLSLLVTEGSTGVNRWLDSLPQVENRWVCFEA